MRSQVRFNANESFKLQWSLSDKTDGNACVSKYAMETMRQNDVMVTEICG